MPIDYRISSNRPLVLVHLWGVVSLDDLLEYYRALESDPGFDPTFWQLTDMREVTELRGDSAAIATAARTKTFTPGVRRAIVAATDLQFGIARMFETYAEESGHTVRVFRDLRAAEKWLEA